MKKQNCENNYLFPGILSTLERARLNCRLQNKLSTMCSAKGQGSLETERLIRKTTHMIPNTIHHSTQTFSETEFMLRRPNSLPLQTQTKFSVIPVPACDVLAIPHSQSLWPKSLSSSHRKCPGHTSLPQQAPASH